MGAVVVTGVVVVGFAIKEALEAYELKWADPEDARPAPETKPTPRESSPEKTPKPEPKGPDFPPLGPIETSERERRPECKPIPVKHLGGNNLHNKCADGVPNNTFSGWDALVNGKNFDALQLATRTLWEVKTDDFDKHSRRSRRFFIDMQVLEIERERKLAEECGYDFIVGVRSAAHKAALLERNLTLKVVVMNWC